jgi:hypothetical protein
MGEYIGLSVNENFTAPNYCWAENKYGSTRTSATYLKQELAVKEPGKPGFVCILRTVM